MATHVLFNLVPWLRFLRAPFYFVSKKITMAVLLRTLRVSLLIGLALAINHMLTCPHKNFVAIFLALASFFVVFGIDYGFRRWSLLLTVAAVVYAASFYSVALPGMLTRLASNGRKNVAAFTIPDPRKAAAAAAETVCGEGATCAPNNRDTLASRLGKLFF